MPIHYDTIEDGQNKHKQKQKTKKQNKTKNLIFYSPIQKLISFHTLIFF